MSNACRNLRYVKEEQMSSLRFQRLWSGLIKVVEKEQADDLNKQGLLVQSLVEVAKKVKDAKDKKVGTTRDRRAANAVRGRFEVTRSQNAALPSAIALIVHTYCMCMYVPRIYILYDDVHVVKHSFIRMLHVNTCVYPS